MEHWIKGGKILNGDFPEVAATEDRSQCYSPNCSMKREGKIKCSSKYMKVIEGNRSAWRFFMRCAFTVGKREVGRETCYEKMCVRWASLSAASPDLSSDELFFV